MTRTPRNRPQMPADEFEPENAPMVAIWVLVSLALWLLIVGAVWSLWPRPTFAERWPAEHFHPFTTHQGHLPRAPLQLWGTSKIV